MKRVKSNRIVDHCNFYTRKRLSYFHIPIFTHRCGWKHRTVFLSRQDSEVSTSWCFHCSSVFLPNDSETPQILSNTQQWNKLALIYSTQVLTNISKGLISLRWITNFCWNWKPLTRSAAKDELNRTIQHQSGPHSWNSAREIMTMCCQVSGTRVVPSWKRGRQLRCEIINIT